mgnify:FL=1
MDPRRLDIPLLVALQAVLREGSVTAAAARLHRTQPAVSAALARARALFGDPLLVRSGARLVPTERARALAPRIDAALAGVAGLLAPEGFDPARAERRFLATANDLSEMLLLPALAAAVAAAGPGLSLVLRSSEALPAGGPEGMEGRMDLVYAGVGLPAPYVTRVLFEEGFVVIARPGHPAFARPPSAEGFAALPQVLVAPRGDGGGGPIDEALARRGLRRRVAVVVTRFAALPAMLAASDLVACVPSRFAALAGGAVEAHPLPFDGPRFLMRLGWHRRHEGDPGHRWLRGAALAAAGAGAAP